MSEGTSEVAEQAGEQEASASKRKTLSLGDRIKVIDYLRAQPEPIVGDSNGAIALHVSTATGVDINWSQLKYMLDELTDINLSAKVHVKSLPLSGDDERWAAMEAKLAALTDRVLHLEANAQP